MFSARHYTKIAQVIRDMPDFYDKVSVAIRFNDMLRDDNPRFDSERFYEACGVGDRLTR